MAYSLVSTTDLNSHHIYDLLKGEAKIEDDGLGLVLDWPLQPVVGLQEVCQQPPLVQATLST
jgi:hypothetical protein